MTPTEALRELVKENRTRRGWSQAQLGARLGELGLSMERMAVARIESGARGVSLDEAVALALALDVPLVRLIAPAESTDAAHLAPGVACSAGEARAWMRGDRMLPGGDRRAWLDALMHWRLDAEGDEERQVAAAMDHEIAAPDDTDAHRPGGE